MQFVINVVIACVLLFIFLASVVTPVLVITHGDDFDEDDKRVAIGMILGFFGGVCLWLLVEMIIAGLLAPLL